MHRAGTWLVGLLAATVGALASSPARAGWQNNFSGFGATLQGDLYTPSNLAASPAVLVAIHMCTGHSTTVHGWFDSFAESNGFYIIAPDAGKQCFDASASRSGDKAAIVKMVDYLITQKNADKNRVFAAGMSSGGCMTNTLLAVYPDVFAGGSAMPGFPAGGWPAGDTTCTKCGSNPPSTDGKYWGDIARNVFQWSGNYPCSQQWVGGGDEYNFNGWLPAVAAQFQNLSNLGSGMSGSGAPSGWTRTVYKDASGNVRLETNLGPTSQKHDLETVKPPLYGNVISFLGLDKPSGACGVASAGSGGTTGGGGHLAGGGHGGGGAGHAGGAGGATLPGTGGTAGIGGPGSGGRTGGAGGMTGGMTGSMTGGSVGTGGATTGSTGGATGTGGRGTGGTAAASGGSSGTGGTTNSGAGGSRDTGGGSAGGCSCETPGPGRGGASMLFLSWLGLAFTLVRRGRRRG